MYPNLLVAEPMPNPRPPDSIQCTVLCPIANNKPYWNTWESLKIFMPISEIIRGLKRTRPNYSCLQETQFKCKDTDSLKVNGWRKVYFVTINQNKTVIVNFKTKMFPSIAKSILSSKILCDLKISALNHSPLLPEHHWKLLNMFLIFILFSNYPFYTIARIIF